MKDVIYVTEFGDWGMFGRVQLFDTSDWSPLDWEILEGAPASERQKYAAEIVKYRAAVKRMVADQREERMTA